MEHLIANQLTEKGNEKFNEAVVDDEENITNLSEIKTPDTDWTGNIYNREDSKSILLPKGKEYDGYLSAIEFKTRGFLSNEPWDNMQNIHSRILEISREIVFCECVMDREEGIVQTRSFPRDLFTHIRNLVINKPILIKLKSKPGSIRIDIFEGEGIVDMELFDIEDGWKLLEDGGLGEPFQL